MQIVLQLVMGFLLAVQDAPSPAPADADAVTLKQRLAGIDVQRDASKKNWEQLELKCLSLLDEKSGPVDRGLVYAQIARIYAITHPEKAMSYGAKALELPLDVETTCKVHISIATALEVKGRGASGEDALEITKSSWKVWLEGLDFVLKQNPPAFRRDLPVVGKFDCEPLESDACKELIEKNRREMEERKRAEFENELVLYRNIFLKKCGELYSEADDETRAALRQTAHRVIADAERARNILKLIERNEVPSLIGEDR